MSIRSLVSSGTRHPARRTRRGHPVAGEGAARPVERHGEKPFLLSVKAPKERPAAAARAIRSWQDEGFENIMRYAVNGKTGFERE